MCGVSTINSDKKQDEKNNLIVKRSSFHNADKLQ